MSFHKMTNFQPLWKNLSKLQLTVTTERKLTFVSARLSHFTPLEVVFNMLKITTFSSLTVRNLKNLKL